MTFRVLVADKLPAEGLSSFADYPEVELDNAAGISREDLLAKIAEVDGLVVRSRTHADGELIAAAKKLKVIGRAGIGVDNIDRAEATRAGVVVMNTPDGNAITTAEHTLALILSMTRRIPQATASLRAGKWEKSKFLGRELTGKTLGVIGLGNIGRIVADRAQGLQMKVIGHDPYFDAAAAEKVGVEWVSVDDLVARADVITVHTPLTDGTRNLISDAQVDRMKPGVMLVNCARGGIYDEAALQRGLEAGRIGALALDVFVEEPPGEHPLLAMENVVATPHLGASTSEAQVQVAVDIARQIGDFARGEPARNAINLPRISANELRVLGPYMALAEHMGSFLIQMVDGPIAECEVELLGEVADRPVLPIGNAAVAGALQHAFDRPVNMVNARMLAEERGIKLMETRSRTTDEIYASSVRVTVTGTDGARHTVLGTLFGKEARFVEVDGVSLEAIPEGYVLVINNEDQPGIIGHIGTILGGHGVNISRMQLGLKGTQALSLVNVDAPVPAAAIVELADHVTWVKQVSL